MCAKVMGNKWRRVAFNPKPRGTVICKNKNKKNGCNKNMQSLMNSTSQMTGSVVSTLKGVIKKFGERGGQK